jgi:hypothetical protein
MLMSAIEQLRERLADHPDVVVTSALDWLSRYADIVARDVIVRREQSAEAGELLVRLPRVLTLAKERVDDEATRVVFGRD